MVDDTAAVEAEDVVGDRDDVVVVSGDHECGAAAGVGADRGEQRGGGAAVELGGWLVGEQERGAAGERKREGGAGLLAAGEFAWLGVEPVGEPELAEQARRHGRRSCSRRRQVRDRGCRRLSG